MKNVITTWQVFLARNVISNDDVTTGWKPHSTVINRGTSNNCTCNATVLKPSCQNDSRNVVPWGKAHRACMLNTHPISYRRLHMSTQAWCLINHYKTGKRQWTSFISWRTSTSDWKVLSSRPFVLVLTAALETNWWKVIVQKTRTEINLNYNYTLSSYLTENAVRSITKPVGKCFTGKQLVS